jgi:MFS family permease
VTEPATSVDTRTPFQQLAAEPQFLRYQAARFLGTFGFQMASVAVGWQVYSITHRPLDLGYVGLVQFLPSVALSLFAGAVADRYDRRRILALCHAVFGLCWILLALLAWRRAGVVPIYVVLVTVGVARAFSGPAAQSMLPNLVPRELFGPAAALSSSAWQVAAISGPALGGALYGVTHGAHAVFLLAGVFGLAASWLVASLHPRESESRETRGMSLDAVLAGVRYVREQPLMLGTISLDLFAVLLGGAVALLPVYARDILHAGPWALGLLRGAPAVGAALMAITLAWSPLRRHAGWTMLGSVAVYGLATVVFALSRDVALSFAALVVVGAADMVSVVVRQHTVQLATPDAMRGRVSAVNLVFISASNELGEFESGVTAEYLGPVRAALLGGVGTLVVVVLWSWWFPALRKLDRPDDVAAHETR